MAEQKSFLNSLYSKQSLIILFFIVLAGIALRLYCFNGLWGTDDAEYARLAHAMAQGNFSDFIQKNYIENSNTPAHWPYRVGIIYPLSILFRLFGVNEVALVAYPLIVSVLGILLAYSCGRLLFNDSAGLMAAAIWAVLPLDVKFATSFLPDVPSSFYASLGIAVILFFINYNSENKFFSFSGGVIGGLLFGISWLSKESVVYLVPFCGVLIFISMRKNWKTSLPLWSGVAVASIGVLLTEMIVYYNLRGDFLLRMHENERSYVQAKTFLFYEGSRFGWPIGSSRLIAIVKRLFISGPQTIFFGEYFLFLPFFGLIASAHSLYWKDKTFLVPALWMLTLIFMYNFWSMSFASYTPLVLSNNRYLHPIMLPAILLTSGFIVKLFSTKIENGNIGISKERYIWGIILAVIIAVTGSYYTIGLVRGMPQIRAIYEIKAVANIVRHSDRLYTDPLVMKPMEFYWGYPEKMNFVNFEGMGVEEITSNSFVLIDHIRVDWLKINVGSFWLTNNYDYKGPEFLNDPPRHWKKVWQNEVATLYRVE